MKKSIAFLSAVGAALLYALALLFSGCGKGEAGLSFSVGPFDGCNARIVCTEAGENAYNLFLPAGADRDSLYVEYAGGKLRCGEKELPNGAVTDCFSGADEVVLTRGKEAYTVRVLQSENLPAVFIGTDMPLNWLHEDKSNQSTGSITVEDGGEVVLAANLSQIKGRGNSTWELSEDDPKHDKKPYNIKLEQAASVLGMPSARKYRLLANVWDDSLLKNTVSLWLARQLGTYGALECRQVDLYINGDYRGNYLLTESIDAGTEKIPINDTDELNELANAPADLKSFPLQSGTDEHGWEIRWRELPKEPEKSEWAFLLELDGKNETEDDLCLFFSDLHHDIALKNPEYASEAQVRYAAELFKNAENALYAEDSPDSDYERRVDQDSAASAYLLQELIVNPFAGTESLFFCIAENSEKVITGPVWDFDTAMWEEYSEQWCIGSSLAGGTNWFSAAFRHEGFRECAQDHWRAFASQYPPEALSRAVRRFAEENAASAVMDSCRWPRDSRDFVTEEDYFSRCDALAEALAARAERMNTAFSDNSAFIWYIYNENEFCTQRKPLSVGDTVIVPSAEQAKAPVAAGFGSFYVNEEDFLCWSENPDGSGRRYAPGEALVVEGNAVTLYAVWRE